MRIIGLTGGIGCGKSSVSMGLAHHGFEIIDADKIAFNIVKKGRPAYKQIVQHFGDTILTESGEINRKKLGEIVFNDKNALKQLNAITHKYVKRQMILEIAYHFITCTTTIILDVPLLIETGLHYFVDSVVVVHCDKTIQIERLTARDSIPREEAIKKISSQMLAEDRLKHANIIFDNNGPKDMLETKIKHLVLLLKSSSWRAFLWICLPFIMIPLYFLEISCRSKHKTTIK